MYKSVMAILLTFGLSACATQGNKIDNESLSQIKKGKTSEQQVVEMFGKPASTGFSSDGSKNLTFSYASAHTNPASYIPFIGFLFSGVDSESQYLYVVVDKNGKVKDYTYGESESEMKTGLF
ncbi:outer membrane protein assembly factor BamE domain-containing protein [Vibrio owensii]|uniref:outer membrane protein assembly factor BamE domain-containing protein n=1 Tax=Vibrio owensii TaxID=696485 RepID=UPI000597E433|nr:outer membrane protein assembly factor BamE [Vibrio owensii]